MIGRRCFMAPISTKKDPICCLEKPPTKRKIHEKIFTLNTKDAQQFHAKAYFTKLVSINRSLVVEKGIERYLGNVGS